METKLKILRDVPLAPLTTLKIGGPARFFVRAESEEEVIETFRMAEQNSLPVFVLGGGSNVLIADEGFEGLVLQIGINGISETSPSQITAGAGVDWDRFVEFCVRENLQGVECLSGIPGFVGGTPVQNVGAYGQEVSETIRAVRCFDRNSGRILTLDNQQCGFSYRRSIFNSTERERYVVLAVAYDLLSGGEPKIAYADLKKVFGSGRPTLSETREAVLRVRSAKAMVIDENDADSRSAGSFFKNPVVSLEEFEAVKQKARALGAIGRDEDPPNFPVDEKTRKIPAAWLIEKSGFHKGYGLGRVGLSTKHTLAITNRGGGTAREVIELKNEIQTGVAEKFGVALHPEPIFIGFEE
ncbi:MAG: UDP-N-acetylmuramate dehydrogenase [Pyrinomonadaceae bacterium]